MDKELFKKAVDKYGQECQIAVLCEECSELVKAIYKIKRFGAVGHFMSDFYEEISDVRIMLGQLFYMMDKEYPDDLTNFEFNMDDLFFNLLSGCSFILFKMHSKKEVEAWMWLSYSYDLVNFAKNIEYLFTDNIQFSQSLKRAFEIKYNRLKSFLEK